MLAAQRCNTRSVFPSRSYTAPYATPPAEMTSRAAAPKTPPEADSETSSLPAAAKNGPGELEPIPRLRPHALVHAPQPIQSSLLITGKTNPFLPSDMVMASFGQAAAHAPHPQQCVVDSNSVGTSPLFTVDIQLSPYLRAEMSLRRISAFI